MSCCKENQNPLLSEWDTPYGIPPFEQIMPEHFMPAFEAAFTEHNAEIAAIINNTAEPTFENTILAYDNSGKLYSRISSVFSSETSVNSNDELMGIQAALSPLSSKHFSEISLNEALFNKIKSVYDKRESLGLDFEQLRLVEETYKGFARAGAALSVESREKLKEVNAEISSLQLTFGQNLIKETAAYELNITDKNQLSGLSESFLASAAERAKGAGKEGWSFGLDNPSIMPFLASADNAELRKQMLDAYLNRCNNDNEFDNKAIIEKLLKLRLEKAKLLGYNDLSEFILEERMAGTPEAVFELLDQIWGPSLKAAKKELEDMAKIAGVPASELTASDWRYYSEKAKAQLFNLTEAEIMPYFKLENAREGIFYVANKLYGVTFTKLENVPLPNPEAIAFECKDVDGTLLGIFFMDTFARPGEKRGGAWCTGYREQYYENGERIIPLVANVCNFSRPVGDAPVLLTADEVETMFHEFGHALHALFQDVKYLGLTGVTRDFVELPSQIMEHWAFEPEVLNYYAKHYETGEVIPAELVEKMVNAGKYGQGFATTEYLAAAYLDMDYHTQVSYPENMDLDAFETKTLADRGLISQIPSRYKTTYFSHTMGGGYTAGYYSYIWSGVLDADGFDAFVETGDIFNQEVSAKFRKEVLERAGVDNPMTLYLNFRGKKPGVESLLKVRGL